MNLTEALIAVTAEATLLFLLSRLLFGCVISSFADRRGKGFSLAVLRLPGNFVHEFSHCLGFWLCGYRVKRMLLCIFDPQGRGSCRPGRAWSPVTFPQLAIGLAALMPIVSGSLILILTARLLGVGEHVPSVQPDQLLETIWQHAFGFVHALNWQHWQTYLFLYLALSIGAELSPSASDLRYAIPTLIFLALGTWLFFFALGHAHNLQHYRLTMLHWLQESLLQLSSVLAVALVITAAAAALTIIPGLMLQALRRR
ncbi:MAG: hypothetical protein ABFE08_07710 [Armatimonadia bacterium]